MAKLSAVMALVLLGAFSSGAPARVNPDMPSLLAVTQAPGPGYLADDIPVRDQGYARTDTIVFGYYTVKPDGRKYAVLDGEWTFDHAAEDSLEGWTAVDQTENDQVYWRQLTQARWLAEGATIVWPQITGDGMVLCGATQGHADSLGWAGGIGYGNDWCQRLISPILTYDGAGTVDLTLKYFSEAEVDFDYTKVFVEAGASRILVNAPGFTGEIGIDTQGVLTPASYARNLSNTDFGGGIDPRTFQVVVEFVSDGGLSDEDLSGPGADSFYGGVGLDDIQLGGSGLVPPTPILYGFEEGLEGWTPSKCPGVGSFIGLGNLGDYTAVDPCGCALSGNVLEMHDAFRQHPVGQHEKLYSPIVDRENDIPAGAYLDYNRILAEWDQYADMPQVNGVFYRAGWTYYPYENPHVPGMIEWSPRVGISTFYYQGDTPSCEFNRSIGTDWGLPSDATTIRFIYEIYGSCAAFGQIPCSGETNFTPLIDNLTVRNVTWVPAPVVQYGPGTRFQDGFSQVYGVGTASPGNADIVYDLRRSTGAPTKLGDSLMVSGPGVSSIATRWEAKLWFRLKRMGPGQMSLANPGLARFTTWKNVVTANKGDFYTGANPNFAWGYMDSVETPMASRSWFCSQFRELTPNNDQSPEPCFDWGGTGEQGEGNEILPDGVFTPGTKIEYFVTANYVLTPTACSFLPDTTGQAYSELEILPSFRTVGGVDKFPALLYVDAFNGGAESGVENALHAVLNGAAPGEPIPDPTRWDRYDYLDASSNWNGPLYRMAGGNGGAAFEQLLGYHGILVSTGTAGVGAMEARDWVGFQQWLTFSGCCSNFWVQGFIADGTSIAATIQDAYPNFLNSTLGATHTCGAYNEFGCAPGETPAEDDQQDCVRVEPTAGSPFGAGVASDVSGNGCPELQTFGVLGVTGTGVGSKVYEKIDNGYQTSFAQVINDRIGIGGPNYRSVIGSCAYAALIARDPANPGPGECRYATAAEDSVARSAALISEIGNALTWSHHVSDPVSEIGLVPIVCGWLPPPCPSDVPDDAAGGALVTRLYQNRPNPFNPRTSIRFSLAADGPTRLVIYDVNGRRVRTLVDGKLKAGNHEVTWDGADDAGHPARSGVYWSQLWSGNYTSNKKMVVLK